MFLLYSHVCGLHTLYNLQWKIFSALGLERDTSFGRLCLPNRLNWVLSGIDFKNKKYYVCCIMNVTSLHVFGNIELIVIPMTCRWIISTPLHAGTGPRLLFKVSSGYFGSPQEAAHRWLRKSLLVICSACFSDV